MEQARYDPTIPKKKRTRRALEKKFDGKQAGAALVRRLPLAGAFFLLSLAQCFSLPSPFAICCLVALRAAGEKPKGALLGLGAGFLYRIAWGLPWDGPQFLLCLLCFPLTMLSEWKNSQVMLLTGLLLLARAMPGMVSAQETQTVILLCAGVLLGVAFMPALLKAARLLKARSKRITQDDALCLVLPVLLLLTGAGRLHVSQINLGYIVSCFGVLAFAWLRGSAAGVCLGLGCGLALLLSGQSALLLVNLAFGALTAGIFQGKNRLLTAGMYALASAASAYLIAFQFIPFLLAAEIGAGLAFCLVPGRFLTRAGCFLRQLRWNDPQENAYTRLKTQRWVQAIERMADALPRPRLQPLSAQEESDMLTDALCTDCDRLPICWHENREQTIAGMRALAEREEDTEGYLRIINEYFSLCPRIARIPELLSRMDGDRQKRMQRSICAEYERDMLQTHLTALSQAAQRISLEGSENEEEAQWTQQIEQALQSIRFPGKTAFVKRVDGHMTVGLHCDPLALRPEAGNVLSTQIGVQLGKLMTVTEQYGDRVILEEEPPLRLVTGMATACAVSPERKRRMGRRPDNGDAVLVSAVPGGRELLALSDGMGHGAGAQDESRTTLELLSLCLEAGYTRAQAMTAVNGAMLSATGGEKFATVDLCLVDLWTGETAMNKLGACASYIVQGQKIHTVEGAALPLGIIEHVAPMEHHFTLGEGDALLLMTDGVTDTFEQEADMLRVLRRCRDMAPQQMADTLLREALMQRDGLPPDDMTVLAARVEGQV